MEDGKGVSPKPPLNRAPAISYSLNMTLSLPSDIKIDIPRDAILDGSNYNDWKMIVTSVLEQKKLTDIVFDGIKPEDSGRALSAKTFLLFSMDRSHRSKISHCSEAHQIWIAIKAIS